MGWVDQKIVQPIVKPVVDVVTGTVSSVADFVLDQVVTPVVNTVGTVVETALSDPITTIAQVAAVATGNVWALPLIAGASVVAKGGNIEQVLTAAAVSYVAGKAGSAVSGYVAPAVTSATGSAVAGAIIGQGASNAAVAVITGQDPLKAFVAGGISAAVPAALGRIDGFADFQKNYGAAAGAIANGIGASLSGGNVSSAMISGAIAGGQYVTTALKDFQASSGITLNPATQTILSDILMGTATAALAGGKPSNVIQNALNKAGAQALGAMASGKFTQLVDYVQTGYTTADRAAQVLDQNNRDQIRVVDQYNAVKDQYNAGVADQNQLYQAYGTALGAFNANKTQAGADAVNAAAKAYETYSAILKTNVATWQPKLDAYAGELTTLKSSQAVLNQDYEALVQSFTTASDQLTTEMVNTAEISNKYFVATLYPDFNADEYAQMNNLDVTGEDPYTHYLSKGRQEGLPVNSQQAYDLANGQDKTVVDTMAASSTAEKFDGSTFKSAAAAQKAAVSAGYTDFSFGGNNYHIMTDAEIKDKIKNASSYGEAFGLARKAYGANATFDWVDPKSGKTTSYATQTAEDKAKAAASTALVKESVGNTDYVKNLVNQNISDFANYNPADLTKKEYAAYVDAYANATEGQRKAMLAGPENSTFKVVDQLFIQARTATGLPAPSAAVGSGNMSASDYTNYLGVLKTGLNTAASDAAQVTVRGLQIATSLFGGDTTKMDSIQNFLATDKATVMSKLVGNEQVIAGGIASGVETAVSWMVGGPVTALASMGAVAANNSWIEGQQAGLSVTDNAKRTAVMTALELAGEAMGIPGMKNIMAAIPKGTGAEIVQFLKAGAGGMLNEQASELLTTTAQFATDKFASFGLAKDATWGDFTKALQDTVVATTAAVGTSGSISVATQRMNQTISAFTPSTTVTPMAYDTVVAKDTQGNNVTLSQLLVSQSLTSVGTADVGATYSGLTAIVDPFASISFGGGQATTIYDVLQSATGVANTTTLTDSAVAEIFRSNDYAPTDAVVQQYVGQPANADTLTTINQFADANRVDATEVKDAYAALGLQNPTRQDVEKLMGYYTETDLAGKATANLDSARYNSIMSQLDALTAGASPEVLNSINTVKQDLNRQIEALGGNIVTLSGTVAQNKTDLLVAIDAAQKGDTAQFANIDKAIADLKAAGLTQTQVDAIVAQSSAGLSQQFQTALADAAKGNTQALTDLKSTLTTQISDVRTELTTALGTQTDAFNARVDDLQKQGVDLQTAMTTAFTELGGDITKLGASFQTKLDTLGTSFSNQLAATQKNILDKVAEYEAAGLSRDAAMSQAVADVATNLNTTSADLLTKLNTTSEQLKTDFTNQIGATKTELTTALATAEKTILDLTAEYEAAGIQRDQALSRAIGEVAANLNTSTNDLLGRINTTEANLNTKLDTARAEITNQFNKVQEQIGTNTKTATQTELDTLIGLLTTGAYDQKYDYNGDGKLDATDRDAIAAVLNPVASAPTPDFNPAMGSVWSPTGIYKSIADEAAKTRAANTAAATKTQRMGNINTMQSMLSQAPDLSGQQVTVKAADPTKIGYVYDFNSIFANPTQEKMFVTPYAEGGSVGSMDEVNDELLKFLKG